MNDEEKYYNGENIEDAEFLDVEMEEIEFDLEMAELSNDIKKYRNNIDEKQINALVEECKNIIIDSMLGPLMLKKDFFNDLEGGPVTTLPNFEKGITATPEDAEKWQQLPDYNRKAYDADPNFKGYKSEKKENGPGECDYSGKESSDLECDHVVPVKEIETDPTLNLAMTEKQRAELAASEDNLAMVDCSLNRSKGDNDLMKWASKESSTEKGITNAEKYGINMESTKKLYERAQNKIKSEGDKALLEKQAKEIGLTGLSTGVKMGTQQVIAIVMQITVTEVFVLVKKSIVEYGQNSDGKISKILTYIKRGLNNIVEKIKTRLKEMGEAFVDGAVTGFLSNFVTFLINNLLTTAKNLVAMIREGLSSLYKAVKAIREGKDLSGAEKIKIAGKILFVGLMACATIAFQETIKSFITPIPIIGAFSDTVSFVLCGIITGIAYVVGCYWFGKLEAYINATHNAIVAANETNLLVQYKIYDLNKKTFVVMEKTKEIYKKSTEELEHLMEDSKESAAQVAEGCAGLRGRLNNF